MPADNPPFLIAAVSGRALAQSARRGGHRVVVLDYFADQDTVAAAVASRAVTTRPGLRFDPVALMSAAGELAPAATSAGLVFGSGFEGRVDLLARLAEGRTLFGNAADTIAALRDPVRFFALLDQLRLPHPAIATSRPADPSFWLVKDPGSAGGLHVRPAAGRKAGAGDFYQRLAPGRPMSALFLANGRRAHLVGFNAQWTAPRPGFPYLYCGATSRVPVGDRVEGQIRQAIDALVAASGLRGLNGLDFLLDGDHWSVLEVNPRPTATMELYDPDWPAGLFDWHLRSSGGELPTSATSGPARAAQIVEAVEEWTMPPAFAFPAWCSDLPWPGTRHPPGAPICTVHAEADAPAEAQILVTERQRQLRRLLGGSPGQG